MPQFKVKLDGLAYGINSDKPLSDTEIARYQHMIRTKPEHQQAIGGTKQPQDKIGSLSPDTIKKHFKIETPAHMDIFNQVISNPEEYSGFLEKVRSFIKPETEMFPARALSKYLKKNDGSEALISLVESLENSENVPKPVRDRMSTFMRMHQGKIWTYLAGISPDLEKLSENPADISWGAKTLAAIYIGKVIIEHARDISEGKGIVVNMLNRSEGKIRHAIITPALNLIIADVMKKYPQAFQEEMRTHPAPQQGQGQQNQPQMAQGAIQ